MHSVAREKDLMRYSKVVVQHIRLARAARQCLLRLSTSSKECKERHCRWPGGGWIGQSDTLRQLRSNRCPSSGQVAGPPPTAHRRHGPADEAAWVGPARRG